MNADKEYVLDFLTREAAGIAEMFGSSCETLIHDMTQPGFPIVAIFNGHISGREIGSTVDVYGGHRAAKQLTQAHSAEKDFVNTFVLTRDRRQIKSSTFNFVGQDYHYALGINYDYTILSSTAHILSELTAAGQPLENRITEESASQLDQLFNECMELVGIPADRMKKTDRLRLIALLDQKNAFDFQKAVTYISEKLHVSRYTIYNYYHELEKQHLVSGAINK